MFVKKLILKNYRNYDELVFEPEKETNLIYGKNGQGKTNIIEALYFFCNGKSYRTSRDTEVVNFEKDNCKIKIDFCQ